MTIPVLNGPILPLAVTLVTFAISTSLFQRSGRHPLCNPVLLSVLALIAMLQVTGISFERYFQGAQYIHFLLGPAVVALAIPLHRQFAHIQRSPSAILLGIASGLGVAVLTGAGAAHLLGATTSTVASIIPKGVTAPVAMSIAHHLGGIPPLAAVLAVLTGIFAASFGPSILNRLGIIDPMARGLALGTAGHGLGTARALQEGDVHGAFAGLAMGLAALAMSLAVPLLWNVIN
jgi:predicted murein hydrolase (TIGR00659 family)